MVVCEGKDKNKPSKREIQYTYKCKNNQLLEFNIKVQAIKMDFYFECGNCEGFLFRKDCFYNYNEEKYKGKNKKLKINRNWDTLKKQNLIFIIVKKESFTDKYVKYKPKNPLVNET